MPSSFSSDSIVLCQVVFGLPLGLFPWGVHLRAILIILDTGPRANLNDLFWIHEIPVPV
jgi:hypothetical protein